LDLLWRDLSEYRDVTAFRHHPGQWGKRIGRDPRGRWTVWRRRGARFSLRQDGLAEPHDKDDDPFTMTAPLRPGSLYPRRVLL